MSFFPRDFEGAKSLKNYEKYFSGNYFRNNFVSEGIIDICLPTYCNLEVIQEKMPSAQPGVLVKRCQGHEALEKQGEECFSKLP